MLTNCGKIMLAIALIFNHLYQKYKYVVFLLTKYQGLRVRAVCHIVAAGSFNELHAILFTHFHVELTCLVYNIY